MPEHVRHDRKVSMTLTFRTATAADLPAVVVLLAQASPPGREDASEPLDPNYIEAFDAIDRDPHHHLLVGEIDGLVIATLLRSFIPGMAFRGAWRAHIESVRVAEHLRGQGIGAQFLAHAVELARVRGCRMVQLMSTTTRSDAHRFYERLGWRRSHYGFKLPLAPVGDDL
jgi:GNAT superfamily N-acetyltransferase